MFLKPVDNHGSRAAEKNGRQGYITALREAEDE